MAKRLSRSVFLAGRAGVILAVLMLSRVYAQGIDAQQPGGYGQAAISAKVDVSQTAAPVSKYLFGSFIEHIGPLIYRSLWSEMIDDRKFYFPILPEQPEQPA